MFTVPESLKPHVRALETLMARLHAVSRTLLDFEMWDRWGRSAATPEDSAKMEAEATEANKTRVATETELEALVARLRAEVPEAVVAWADAHDDLLAAFIDRCEGSKDDQDARVGRSVAEGERSAWAEVRRGTRAFVSENTVYVHVDADRYRALFDVELGAE